MTDLETYDYALLKMATEEDGVFAIEVGASAGSQGLQFALERMQRRGWVTLIDVSTVSASPGTLFRIFKASSEAMTWFRSAN